jgi:hypothetical protein
VSPIATIYEEPEETKPYRSTRPERDDGPVLETLFLEDLDATKSASSYAPWHRAADVLLLGACLGKEQHITIELSEIHEQLQSLLGVLKHGDQDAASRCVPHSPTAPCAGPLIWQIEEARP